MIQLNLFLSWQIKGTNRYYKNVDLVDFIDYLVNGTGRVSGNKYSTTRKSSLSFNLTQPPGSHHFPDFLSAFLPSNLSSTLQLSMFLLKSLHFLLYPHTHLYYRCFYCCFTDNKSDRASERLLNITEPSQWKVQVKDKSCYLLLPKT